MRAPLTILLLVAGGCGAPGHVRVDVFDIPVDADKLVTTFSLNGVTGVASRPDWPLSNGGSNGAGSASFYLVPHTANAGILSVNVEALQARRLLARGTGTVTLPLRGGESISISLGVFAAGDGGSDGGNTDGFQVPPLDMVALPDLDQPDLVPRWKLESPLSAGAIWGSDVDHIWAIGAAGKIYFSNGQGTGTWAIQPTPTSTNLHDLWGTSATDVYAVGDGATLLHFDGNSWTDISTVGSPSPRSLSNTIYTGLAGWAPTKEVYITTTGKHILHKVTNGWAVQQTISTGSMIGTFNGAAAYAPGKVLVVGDYRLVLRSVDGGDNFTVDYGSSTKQTDRMLAVRSFDTTGVTAFAVQADSGAMNGHVYKSSGTTWSTVPTPNASLAPLTSIGGSAVNDLYITGWRGQVYHYDGSKWWYEGGFGLMETTLGVWSPAPSTVWLTGTIGIYKRN